MLLYKVAALHMELRALSDVMSGSKPLLNYPNPPSPRLFTTKLENLILPLHNQVIGSK